MPYATREALDARAEAFRSLYETHYNRVLEALSVRAEQIAASLAAEYLR